MKIKKLLTAAILMIGLGLNAQNKSVGIGTTSPDPSAVLHLESTNQGFMMTHLTNAQITSIASPKNGLIIYSITDSCYWFYKANHWDKICGTVHQIDHYIYTDTLVANTATINTLHADSVFANYINTNFIHTDSIIANYGSFDTLLVGGQTINNVITNQIDSTAWLLKGNSGTNPTSNFLGTKDSNDMVVRTNDIERLRVLANGGNVGIGTNAPNQSALLHLESTNKGFMMPHLTNIQITAITSPINGLIVYSTTDSCYWFYKANHWDKICGTEHIVANYVNTDTLIANIAHIDSLIGNYITANYINATTIVTNSLTANTVSTNTLIVGGQTINNVISNQIDSTAWLLKGNSGTNPITNFLGTKDSNDMVIRTNNIERMRVLANGGKVGINTNAPTNNLDINGGVRIRPGAALNYLFLSDALGNGTWQPASTILTPGNLNSVAWDLLGNTGTTPTINFLGTKDSNDMVIRTNNIERMRVLANGGKVGINTNTPTNNLDINGGIRIRPGAALNYFLISDAAGNGTWQNPSAALNNVCWKLLGNSGTNPFLDYVGTSDPEKLTFRTNALSAFQIDLNQHLISLTNGTAALPAYSFSSTTTGFWTNPADFSVDITTGGVNVADFGQNIILTPSIGNNNNTITNEQGDIMLGMTNTSSAAVLNNTNSNGIIGYVNTLTNAKDFYVLGSSNHVTLSSGAIIGGGNTIVGSGIFPNGTYAYIVGAQNTSSTNSTFIFGHGWSNTHSLSTLIGNGGSSWANGGVNIYGSAGTHVSTNIAGTTGVSIAVGGGAWATISDRTKKENITEIDKNLILDKVFSIPVTEWTYISQRADTMNKYSGDGIRYETAPKHIGPMAQDFSKVFGYGEYKDRITTSDIDGVVFAALQALIEKQKQLEANTGADKIKELEKTISELQIQLVLMKKAIEDLQKK